jgi:hypothetical protein
MRRSLRIRGKQHGFEQIEGLLAVRPRDPAEREQVIGGRFGKPVPIASRLPKTSSEAALADGLVFEKAGWIFVAPDPQPTQPDRDDSPAVARVWLDSAGHLLLAPGRLTIKLRPEFSESEAAAFLERSGVEVVRRLRFGRNLYEVAVPPSADELATAAALASHEDVEYAEPEMIEHIERRNVVSAS